MVDIIREMWEIPRWMEKENSFMKMFTVMMDNGRMAIQAEMVLRHINRIKLNIMVNLIQASRVVVASIPGKAKIVIMKAISKMGLWMMTKARFKVKEEQHILVNLSMVDAKVMELSRQQMDL